MSTLAWVIGLWVVGSFVLALMVGGLLRRLGELFDEAPTEQPRPARPGDHERIGTRATAA